MEVLFLVVGMVAIAFVSLRIGKILPNELALVPLIMMLIMDGMLIYGFKEFAEMENKHIAFSIIAATISKVLILVLLLPNKKIRKQKK